MTRLTALAATTFLAGLVCSDPAAGQASESSFTSAARFDLGGRLAGTISPDPDGSGALRFRATRNMYDATGRVIRTESGELAAWQSEAILPENWTGFTIFSQVDTTYDSLDRKTVERVWAGGVNHAVTQYSYDASGRLECTAVRMNPAAYTSLPSSACAQGVAGGYGPDRITRSLYDPAGRVLQVRKAVGTAIEQAYATYSYTPNGKQEYVIDARGNRAKFVYDGFDRQSQWQFPSASAPATFNPASPTTALATAGVVNSNDREEYGYDANGNRTSLRKRDGRTFTYNYDALNRMTAKIVPDACVSGYACTNVGAWATRDVYYSYDLRGLQTGARFDSASGLDGVASSFDGFGRQISSTTTMGNGTIGWTLNYQYDANGNRTRITHSDGNYFTYEYDGLDRLAYIRENGGAVYVSKTWNAQGLPATESRSGVGTSYGYDSSGALSSLIDNLAGTGYDISTTFIRNPAGQIGSRARSNDSYRFTGYVNVNRSYAVNGLNQYGSAGGVSFNYDANGNLTTSGSTSYIYDAENRLSQDSNGLQLAYDALGRLFQTATIGGVPAGTRFLYDGDQLVAEYDASGTLLRRYVHGVGDDDPLLWYEGAALSNRRSLQVDHIGTVISIADAAGNATAVYNYDEYGIPGNTNYSSRFQYTGQAWIPELGMYYYKARIYSPTLGRFLQTDPVGYDDQLNIYTYVSNDPMNARDPNGMWEVRYHGSNAVQLKAAVKDAASADPELAARLSALEKSKNIHNVYEVDKFFSPKPSASATEDANASNGVGSGSNVYISLKTIPLVGQGVNGRDIDAPPGAQAAHELLDHAFRYDKGNYVSDEGGQTDSNGNSPAEQTAIATENIYRNARNLAPRTRHGPSY